MPAPPSLPIRICDANATSASLPFDRLVDAIERAAIEKDAGTITCPERLVVPLADGATLLSMPAVADDFAIHKLITVAPRNAACGLATIQGVVTVVDPRTGATRMVLDGPTVTGRRTAAVSMCALRRLAPDADSILLIGTGTQASHHAEALAALLPGCRLRVRGTSVSREEAFCDRHRGLVADLAPARDDEKTAVVMTCTASSTPVWHGGDDVRLVIAVGAFRPSMAEVAPHVVRASAAWVDDRDGARHEAGDLIQADVDWSAVGSLAELIRDPVTTIDHGLRLFKSVGCAAWDLAAARVAMQAGLQPAL